MIKRFVIFNFIILLFVSNTLTAGYYEELKAIEANVLNDIEKTNKKLTDIGRNKSEFTPEETYLYLVAKGHSQITNSNFPESIKTLKKVVDSDADVNFKARAHSLLSAAFTVNGRFENVYYHQDLALSLVPEMDNDEYKIKILSNALNNYNDLGMLDYAMDYARRLLKVGHRKNNKGAQCLANIEIVLMELSAEQVDLANKRLKEVNKVCDESVGKLILLNIPSVEAKAALKGGDNIKAKKILESHYKTIKDFGWEVLTSIIETDLAKAYYQLGNYKKAEELALIGYKRTKETTDIKRQRNVVKVLALISTELEKEAEALNYYKEYIELEQKINTSVRQRKLAFSKARIRIQNEQLAKAEAVK